MVKGSEISIDMVNSVVTIPDVYFASTTGGNKTNFDGTADGVTLSFRNNYNCGQVGAGYYDVTVVVSIYNGAASLYVINYALPSVVVDDIIYTQTSATDAAVSGVSIDKASLTKALIHETVTINGHELNVTSINDDAFSGCELKSVTIADATTSISCNQAFSEMTIESLYLGRNWSGIFSGVHNVTFGAQVTSIPERAFNNSPLSEISIPATVETIGSYAFSGCAALASVNLNDGLTRIGNRAFSNCTALTQIEIPATVETVGHPGYSDGSVFDGCTSLETLIIADGDTELSADFSCPSLKNLYLGRNCNNTWNNYDTPELSSVTLGTGITTIAKEAFKSCSKLASITISASVKNIHSYAFQNCSALKTVIIEDSAEPLVFAQDYTKDIYTDPPRYTYYSDWFKNAGIENLYIGRPTEISLFEHNPAYPFKGITSIKNLTIKN